jgi:hypothetical protein
MINLLEQASLVLIPSGYKEDVVYSEIPLDGSGDLQLTRASNGTRINSAGLVEVVPWNMLLYSEDLSNGNWTKSGPPTMTYNIAVAPNGTMTADGIQDTIGSGYRSVYQIVTGITPNSTFTFSIYVKKETSETNYGGISMYYSGSTPKVVYGIFDAVNGTINFASSSLTPTYQIVSVGNYWRIELTTTDTGLNTQLLCEYYTTLSTNGTSLNYGIGSVRTLWGAQLNIGSTAKPYFPTTDRLNVPRLTYQNGGGGCPSLLLEKQSTNIVLNSNNAFSDGTNGSSATTTTPSVIDGVNYRKMTATAVDGNIFCNVSLLSSTPTGLMCFSIFLKKGSCDDVQLIDQNTTGKSIRVNLSNGAIISQSSGLVCGVESYGNDVYRVYIVQDFTSIGFRYDLFAKEIGDFYYTTAQMESGSYPTSVIITNGSSATRVADACFKTGISSLIGQTEGTFFFEIDKLIDESKLEGVFYVSDGTSTTNVISFYFAFSNQMVCNITESNTTQAQFTIGTITTRTKIALAYKANDFALYKNGVQVGTDSSGSVPALNKLTLGATQSGTAPMTGVFNQAVIFPTRLTNAELASLTTL